MCDDSATSMRLGSQTIILAPLSIAVLTRQPTIGWASVGFEPIIRMQSICGSSSYEFVLAPEPNDWFRPDTVAEWQTLAQWSTLFVPNTALANFIIRKFSSFVQRAEAHTANASGPYFAFISFSLSAT